MPRGFARVVATQRNGTGRGSQPVGPNEGVNRSPFSVGEGVVNLGGMMPSPWGHDASEFLWGEACRNSTLSPVRLARERALPLGFCTHSASTWAWVVS